MINIAIKRTGPLDWTLSYLLRSLYTVNPYWGNKKNWSARLNFKLPAAQSVYRKSYIKPPPPGGGAYLFQAYLRRWGGGLTWDGELIWEGLLI